MKYIDFYKKLSLRNTEEVFDYFYDTLIKSNRTWEYYTDWSKIKKNINKFDSELMILNKLVGEKNFDN